MTYEETIDYLYESMPVYQNIGKDAYKPGLSTSLTFDEYLEFPHRHYKIIHVAGTNGKGSTSHLLAAILQGCGYKTGLFTSPHLVDFRERIRVDGKKIEKQYVVDFVKKYASFISTLNLSFFELTTALAFDYFRAQQVDFAIIEVGLGGRLDSTNIVTPLLSIITNISLDHTQYLGHTLEAIATEKAGIIKNEVPVIIGECDDYIVKHVFLSKAKLMNAPIRFAGDEDVLGNCVLKRDGQWSYRTKDYGLIKGELGGTAQEHNTRTVLTAVRQLIELGVEISPKAVTNAFPQVTKLTGLMGRWQKLSERPLVICDTGHNIGGWQYISAQLKDYENEKTCLRMVVGMVKDKEIKGVLNLMPRDGVYYFTQASIDRAMPVSRFAAEASRYGLLGAEYPTVRDALVAAIKDAAPSDLIFIGGSTFIVAEALPLFLESSNLIND